MIIKKVSQMVHFQVFIDIVLCVVSRGFTLYFA